MFHLSTARKNLDVCEATEEGQSSTGLGHKSKSKNSEEIFQCCLFLFLKFATSLCYGNAQLFWTNQFSRVNSATTESQTIMRRSLSFITVELTPRAGHCHHAELGALHLGHTEMLHGDPALMGNPGIPGVGKQSFSLTPMGQVVSQSVTVTLTAQPSKPAHKGYLLPQNVKVKDCTRIASVRMEKGRNIQIQGVKIRLEALPEVQRVF